MSRYAMFYTFRRYIATFAIISVCVAGLASCYLVANPPDRVRVTVRKIPDNVVFMCLMTEIEKSASPLYWYTPGIVPPPTARHPATCSWSYLDDEDKENGFTNY